MRKSMYVGVILALALTVMGLFSLMRIASASLAQETRQSATAPATEEAWMDWPSQPPKDCPFAASKTLAGIRFTGRHMEYAGADTWYPSWASDGNLYSPFADGYVAGAVSNAYGKAPSTGSVRIEGDDPLHLKIAGSSAYVSEAAPYAGRYPCGTLVHDGVWYYGTYCLNSSGKSFTYDIMGPFVGFRWSKDFGKTWTQTPHTPAKPIFGEPARLNGKVKFGSPHFVDFGKNLQNSPDGKAYLVGHGAVDSGNDKPRPAQLSWITGDQAYLARVKPSIENMNDAGKYEFFAGLDDKGQALWSAKLAAARPLAQWNNNMGCVTITYDAPLKKYLMCVTDGGNTNVMGAFNTYILESDRVGGPFKLVHYLREFGKEAYFVNIPSKFISADGRTMWLCYSANFAHGGDASWVHPPGSKYALCLMEFRLIAK